MTHWPCCSTNPFGILSIFTQNPVIPSSSLYQKVPRSPSLPKCHRGDASSGRMRFYRKMRKSTTDAGSSLTPRRSHCEKGGVEEKILKKDWNEILCYSKKKKNDMIMLCSFWKNWVRRYTIKKKEKIKLRYFVIICAFRKTCTKKMHFDLIKICASKIKWHWWLLNFLFIFDTLHRI